MFDANLLNQLPHESLHNVLVSLVYDLRIHQMELKLILANTEHFDAELSMRAVEASEVFTEASAALVRKSLNDLGYSDELIDSEIEKLKKHLNEE